MQTASDIQIAPPGPRDAVIGDNRPPNQKPVFRRTCPECGQVFETTTADRLFCTDTDKAAFHNRSSKIGRTLIPLAMAWRAGRNIKGKNAKSRAFRATASNAFGGMCRLLDEALREDRAAERMTKIRYLRVRAAMTGELHADLTVAYHQAAVNREQKRLDEAKAALAAAKVAAKAVL